MTRDNLDQLNNLEEHFSIKASALDQAKDQPLISISIGCFVLIFSTIVGTIANSLAIRYFSTKSNIFFNALKIVALSDFFICVLSTFYGVSLVKGRDPLLFENVYFCWGWNLSWRIAVWFSSHLVAIQSILRSIKIYRPFQVLPKNILKVLLSFDFIIISGTILLSTSTLFKPVYTKSHASCLYLSFRQGQEAKLSLANRVIASIFILALPHVVTLLCCALCLIKLIKQNRVAVRRSRPRGLVRNRNHSIKSILAFSITGLILNVVSFIPFLMNLKASSSIEETNDKDGISRWRLLYSDLFFREIIITLNSILNPFIFLWRMADFRLNISLTVLQPFVATFFQTCLRGGRLVQPQVELRDMRMNYSNPDLRNNHANSPHNINPNSPQNTPQQSNPNSPQNSYPNSPQNSYPYSPQNSDPNSPQNSPQNSNPNSPQNSNPNSPQSIHSDSPQNSNPNSPQNRNSNSPQNRNSNSPQNSYPNSPQNNLRNGLKDDCETDHLPGSHEKVLLKNASTSRFEPRDEEIRELSERATSELKDIGAASNKIEGKSGDQGYSAILTPTSNKIEEKSGDQGYSAILTPTSNKIEGKSGDQGYSAILTPTSNKIEVKSGDQGYSAILTPTSNKIEGTSGDQRYSAILTPTSSEDSELCECECCFLETKKVKQLATRIS